LQRYYRGLCPLYRHQYKPVYLVVNQNINYLGEFFAAFVTAPKNYGVVFPLSFRFYSACNARANR
jgi:hypothetical protein